jgi:hypothetical protein
VTEWFLLHDNPPQLWEPLHITHRVEGDDIVWSIPVTRSFEVLPLPVPKEGRWHRCQNRKRLPVRLRPAKKRAERQAGIPCTHLVEAP